MEWLKEFLGDDLYSQVEAKLKDNEKVKLGNLASGEYVSKSKYDDKIKELDAANGQIETLTKSAEEYKGVDPKELQNQLTTSKQKYEEEVNLLKASIKKNEEVDKWLDAHPSKHRSLLKTQFNLDKIEIGEDGTVKGIEEQGTAIAESYKDLFVQENDSAGGLPQGGSPTGKDPSQMSMEEYKAWREKQ